jgi:hypothetical protein
MCIFYQIPPHFERRDQLSRGAVLLRAGFFGLLSRFSSLIVSDVFIEPVDTPAEVHLSHWFEEFLADQWDRRIEADILAGRLEAAGRRADEDFESGRCTPLSP